MLCKARHMIRNLSSSQNVLAHKESCLDLSYVVRFLFRPSLQNVLKMVVLNGGWERHVLGFGIFFVGFGIFVLCLLAKCFEGGGAKRRLRETRTIFLLFLRDGSLYLPLPDIQQFIVEYLKMSENIGRIWKTSDVENLCPVTWPSYQGRLINLQVVSWFRPTR